MDWQSADQHRFIPLAITNRGAAGFTLLPPEITGVTFSNLISTARYSTNQIFLNGSGVAAGDVDGDDLCDLYFCGGAGSNRLYRNLGGWRFEDITEQAGVGCPHLNSTGAVFADLDGDDDLDLIVNSVGTGTDILMNDGRGRFTRSAVLNPLKGGMSMALGDIDNDADLDLYIANYRTSTIRDHPGVQMVAGTNALGELIVKRVDGRPTTDPDLVGRFTLGLNGRIVENGESDALYRNDGKGHFTAVSFTEGTFLDESGRPLQGALYDWGLSVMMRDVSGDGAPDIYVCNDFESEDRFWISVGPGRFRAIPRLALRHTSMFSMGLDFADLNRDGHYDLFVADMLSLDHAARHVQTSDAMPTFLGPESATDRPQYPRNTLFVNRGDGSYAEIAEFSGLEASDWTWSPVFLDVDLDGYEDLLVTTGHERDERNIDVINHAENLKKRKALTRAELLDLRRMFARLATPNRAFRNKGNLTFEEVSRQWGFHQTGVSHAMALADLDNDGDLDLALNNLNAPASLYRNESAAPRIALRLKGRSPNTQGIGAKLKVIGGPLTQMQEMICGGRYLSGDDAIRVFATGTAQTVQVEITWRSGKKSVIEQATANCLYQVSETSAGPDGGTGDSKPPVSAHFQDVSSLLQHAHHEIDFDDFALQPLLPNRLSQLGPGVSWSDINRDGWVDLSVGAGKGGTLGIFLNDRNGGFTSWQSSSLGALSLRDQTTILGWSEHGRTSVLIGAASYEDGRTNDAAVIHWSSPEQQFRTVLAPHASSVGPLALGDIDSDGDLDLVVAGRCVRGRYPEPADTLLFTNEGGQFHLRQRLAKVGMVSGAVLSDFDSDGDCDLIVACEWGPIRAFRNTSGTFKEITQELGLDHFHGWWTGVLTGDFNNDGQMDLLASNWGLNHKFRTSQRHPRRLYYGDFGGHGAVQLVEAYFDPDVGHEVPERGFKEMSAAFPFITERIHTYEAYGKTALNEIFGGRLDRAQYLQVTTLESSLFLNLGGRLERRPLPAEAQMSPALGLCSGDVDGDGNEDVFLCQNFFATRPGTSRNDSGRGLWLRGDGTGQFQPWSGQESGVRVYGDQRACALADYDADGRLDLVVTQNRGVTRLFRNTKAAPGFRVRLHAGAGNPNGIGTVVRFLNDGQPFGRAREVHAGSGYWSQDDAVQILHASGTNRVLWVRWPGGKTSTYTVPDNARELEISPEKLAVIR